ncbi:glycoside hydrolase family 17 protein, partial [Lentithecium fluviatile CBS 122367]
MKLWSTILLAGHLLVPTATAVYTGFAYGAYWSEAEPKFKKDFVRQFNLAKNLPDVPVPFNSARLFQAGQWLKPDEPSEAFEAAIETKTTLLLGLWLSAIDTELVALDKAFEKHGQALAELVVGISVGNEDIYRSTLDCTLADPSNKTCTMAGTADQVMAKIMTVRAQFAQKPWWKFFKDPPPIGHTDVAKEAGLKGLDFTGTTIYPWWAGVPIEKAKDSFFGSLAGVQERAGNSTPVWITETGWSTTGPTNKTSVATVEAMQKYWTEVGCSIFGKYNVWWFELEKDSPDDKDWGIIDIPSQKPKIKDLSCPGMPRFSPSGTPSTPQPPAPSSSQASAPVSSSPPQSSTLATVPNPSASAQSSSPPPPAPPAPSSQALPLAPVPSPSMPAPAPSSPAPSSNAPAPVPSSPSLSWYSQLPTSAPPTPRFPAPASSLPPTVQGTAVPTPPSTLGAQT